MPLELERIYGRLGFPKRVIYSNFVSSVDGVVTLGPTASAGSVISGRNQADRFLMGLLRAFADAVLLGAGTLRATPGHDWTPEHIYPDLSSSYQGATLLVPPGDGLVREAVVTGDSGREMSWAVVLGSARCPEVTTHAYVWGKSPRAQVTLTFAQRAWITAEHPATYVGSPILAPVLVTGLGFVPSSPLTVRLAGEVVTTADADDKGGVEASFFVPKRQPGVYELSVSDATGRRASRPLTITDER